MKKIINILIQVPIWIPIVGWFYGWLVFGGEIILNLFYHLLWAIAIIIWLEKLG